MTQHADLARPFPQRCIETKPGSKNIYVKHGIVNQALLLAVGPFDWECAQIIRGDMPEVKPNPQGNSKRAKDGSPALSQVVVGVVGRLTIEIDGRRVTIEEAGDCEDPRNWPHDGARMKDAMSDAFKRCCMRPGLGLHLWCGDEYFLGAKLKAKGEQDLPPEPTAPQPPPLPHEIEAGQSPAGSSGSGTGFVPTPAAREAARPESAPAAPPPARGSAAGGGTASPTGENVTGEEEGHTSARPDDQATSQDPSVTLPGDSDLGTVPGLVAAGAGTGEDTTAEEPSQQPAPPSVDDLLAAAANVPGRDTPAKQRNIILKTAAQLHGASISLDEITGAPGNLAARILEQLQADATPISDERRKQLQTLALISQELWGEQSDRMRHLLVKTVTGQYEKASDCPDDLLADVLSEAQAIRRGDVELYQRGNGQWTVGRRAA